MTDLIPITCVTDALNIIYAKDDVYQGKYSNEMNLSYWFRGQNDASHELQPAVFREEKIEDEIYYYHENNIFIESELLLSQYKERYQSTFDWLCMMQHYRLPTRLLDWTESILVALYFAVEESPYANDKDGKVFLLNTRLLNLLSRGRQTVFVPNGFETVFISQMSKFYYIEHLLDYLQKENAPRLDDKTAKITSDLIHAKENTIEMISYPIAVYPHRLNDRMRFQSSVFTIHGGKAINIPKKEKLTPLPKPKKLEEINRNEFLQSFIIPKDLKKQIRKELFLIGIHKGSLFPELEYQTSVIKDKWKTLKE